MLDDFGTGNSAFGYLSRFPIDALKIDRSFVAGITIDARHRAIVQAMIEMAGAPGIEVVAEGVETRKQMDRLIELGCTFAQGFHFAQAAEAEHLSSLLSFNILPLSSDEDQHRREASTAHSWRRLLHGVPPGRRLAATTHPT